MITWSAMPCAYNYKMQYRKNGTSAWTTVTTSATSSMITGLIGKTNYDYHVQTVCTSDGTSSSAYTATKNFTTLAKREALEDGNESTLNDMSIYPNPAKNDFTLEIVCEHEASATVILFNSVGAQVISENIQLSEGKNTVPFESINLPSGLYLISIQIPGEKMIRRITIAK